MLNARASKIESLRREPVDVLIIGGGIVGSGVARDAAMRGLRTALVDRFDFAFGTSSRSSRLLHGGLRYLAQGRIGLVREASVEKVTLSHIAPHLAMPLPFIFPSRRGTEWKRWKLSIGVKVYDLLCGAGKNLGKSQTLSRDQTLALLPRLDPDRLTGAVRYFDAMTNDSRLVLDTLRSAETHGATLLNYAPVGQTSRAGDAWRCDLTDTLTASPFAIQARCIVNATGAWANRFPVSGVKLRLTKGVHLVIDRQRLSIPDAVVMSEGSRILFAIPWGERVILGTTDTDYDGPTDSPRCEESDLRYVLDVANANFPTARLTPDDVISTWVGLRPLISNGDEHGKPSDISRAHQIKMPQPGWIDVAGGKLTTYRLMAEQTVDRLVEHLKLGARACTTATTPLLASTPSPLVGEFSSGGEGELVQRPSAKLRVRSLDDYPSPQPSPTRGEGEMQSERSPRESARSPLTSTLSHKGRGDQNQNISGILPPPVSREVVEHFCRNEWAVHLYDVMIRRTSWRYYHRDHREIAQQVATWMSELLGWSQERTVEELMQYNDAVSSAAGGLALPSEPQTQQVQTA